jgi:hypothetical protein
MGASAGYSGTPLVRKLGIRQDMAVRLHDAPAHYWDLLAVDPRALGIRELGPRSRAAADFQHIFATEPEMLERALQRARRAMAVDGMVWVSWPKRAAVPDARVGRAEVMAAGQACGLVDVKVCAVDDTWSGLKFVIPRAER